MESFNINRFGKTLRWYLSVNFRNLMMWLVGLTAAFFLGEMLMINANSGMTLDRMMELFAINGAIFLVIGMNASFSSIMSDVNKRPKRMAFLMLPVSNLEKFLSLVFYVTVVWVPCLVLSLIAGDSLRMVVRAMLFGDEWMSSLPTLIGMMQPDRFWLPETVFYVLLTVFTHSMYILGGTWLRKYAFVVTTLVLIAIPVLLQYVFIEPGKHLNLFVIYNGVRSVNPLGYVLDVAFVILSCLNYWASFHIFKHFELITNKWTNYDILKR